MPLHVAFLWHMHQPSYVDPVRKTAMMPWVRLHATKGYLDMIWLVDQVPQYRCTFNITPVLIQQIEQLSAGTVRDLWHELAVAPADALSLEQKCGLLEHYFKANYDNMIKPYPRYWTLLQKRGVRTGAIRYDRLAENFSVQEYRDLQAWFNLTWFGYAGERLYPEIAALKRKGGDFTEDDKQTIFAAQRDVLKNLLSYYRAVAERGQIEISTTPFYHPILPLVYNTEFARRCMPGAQLPPNFSHPEDVRAQLVLARELHAKTFGAPPLGLWPSEGSVCPELIPILQELGFEWFATDEDILRNSLAAAQPEQGFDRSALHQGYRAYFGDANICAAFRERTLSDFVGFTASRNTPERAAKFMLSHLEEIAKRAPGDDAFCAVVLDGENAWENFSDGGQGFLRELYERLAGHSELRTTTFHDYFSTHPPEASVRTLHTGSWIQANFKIWIGHPEDNRAWELLDRTRQFLAGKIGRGELTPEQQQQALDEIYAAEGSDWFWWYGDDFVTDNDLIFDELFRTHLQNVYRVCGASVPDLLKTHICRSEVTHVAHRPTDLINPVIDGRITSFYEWAGAGVYEAGRAAGAMYHAERLVESIHFGFNQEHLFIRVDFRESVELPERTTLRIDFVQPRTCAVVVPQLHSGESAAQLWEAATDGSCSRMGTIESFRFEKILELAVPFSQMGYRPREQVTFFVQILDESLEMERHPEIGLFQIVVPDELFEVENWRI